MIKDKRLQIRVTAEELEGIGRRAQAAGLSIAEYGRKRLLAGDRPVLGEQEYMNFEDPGLSREEILEDDSPEDRAAMREVMDEAGYPASDWTPTIPGREYITDKTVTVSVSKHTLEDGSCGVKDVPPGVRCISCGRLHGS